MSTMAKFSLLVLVVIAFFSQRWWFVLGEQEKGGFYVQHQKLVDRALDDTAPANAIMITLTPRYDNVTNVGPVIKRLIAGTGAKVKHVYNNAVKGASIINISPSNIIKLLNKRAVRLGVPINKVWATGVQSSPPWGLDRIDQSSTSLDSRYTHNATGRGVTVYVVDTGIKVSHSDFGGRATCSFSSIEGMGCEDENKHGTHVAGTIGGTKYGVAKRVELVGIRVLDGEGFGANDGVIAGIDYVTGLRKGGNKRPMVINMSLGGSYSEIINMASNAAAQAGITVVVAAGNDSGDACDSSPASAEKVISVGATDDNDASAYFSSQGRCVEIFAPGVDVESASIKCDTCAESLSGTSMASPHVAGVAALYLEKNPSWKPHQVLMALRASALTNRVTDINFQGTPNLLLNMAGL